MCEFKSCEGVFVAVCSVGSQLGSVGVVSVSSKSVVSVVYEVCTDVYSEEVLILLVN